MLYRQWTKIMWIRACELSGKVNLFPNSSSSNSIISEEVSLIVGSQIKQGILKNSNLLSAILAVAEDPQRIMKLFRSTKGSTFGVYDIQICKNGKWEFFLIDDYLPCDFKKKALCFSTCIKNEFKDKDKYFFWLPLLEKAFAKAYGSYFLLETVTLSDALRNLTGASVYTLDNSSEDLWNELKNAFNNNYIILASSGDTLASKELLKEVGLIPFNSYNVLEAHEIELDESGATEYLLKIRNHWGPIEWTGDWSQFSNHWKEDLKQMLNFNSDKETAFWMNLTDFKHYFTKFHICKIDEKAKLSSIKINQNKEVFNLLKLSVKDNINTLNDENDSISKSDVISQLSLVQQDSQSFTNDIAYSSSIGRFTVCRISQDIDDKSNYIYLEGVMGKEKIITKDYNLPPGEYLIYIEIDWNTERTYNFSFNCYSKYDTFLTFLKNADYPNILENIYKSAAKLNDNKHYFIAEGAPNCYKSTKVTPEGYAFIYFNNDEDDSTLVEDVKYTKFDGFKLLSPYTGTSYFIQVES